jgi:hypothetical protein
MPLSELLFVFIVFYLLYRFVFHFLLPVIRATHHVKRQFRNMQGGADTQQTAQTQEKTRPAEKAPVGEYIDFEEVE